MIGPFFVNPYGLGWRAVRRNVTGIIREIALEHFGDDEKRVAAWLGLANEETAVKS